MNIINTAIVNPGTDVYWQSGDELIAKAAPKNVLVLTTAYEAGSIEERQLQKMLEVCTLVPDQYNIVAIKEGQQIAWHRLREAFKPKIVFLLGVFPAQLGISASFRLNEGNHFDGGIWLPTLSLTELEQKQEVKKQLWQNGMKPIFVDTASTDAK